MIHKPYNKFKGWLRENGITYSEIAEVLGISVVTVSAKINGTSDFLLTEILLLEKKYGLDSSIFLCAVLPKR